MTVPRFADKVALVTGAGSGIGRATAIAFAKEGASVVLIDLARDGLDETRSLVEQANGSALALSADVTDEDAVQAAFAQAVAWKGAIHCAFNNAGITHATVDTADIPKSEFERVLKVNVLGVWLCMREELRHMIPRASGVIVNTGSVMSTHSCVTQGGYVASKAAVFGMTKNAAVEYGATGVRINAVAPGGIRTAMMSGIFENLTEEQRDQSVQQIADIHPMKRTGRPEEIADGVLFLCSDQATFITGAMLAVDGGWSAL
ncbi:hypothetical protein BSL82_04560 [Tardibacter chloracetimidivorans]|uniref:Short-chain dehydrogenase n=1 Tax=Tardibacter chloracetimidivorans TaxID=1921510 RepID=A0A1L3ZSR1_9SPHN|nr:glucose 1-dehydrogenase [Tardibacter chloracetimidivorans]API58671.1 hypothetical protein BSL82_04560 [Tardibacter chloracetimidivorans]